MRQLLNKRDLFEFDDIINNTIETIIGAMIALGQRGIKLENLPASEDIRKLERRVKRQERKIASKAGKLPTDANHSGE